MARTTNRTWQELTLVHLLGGLVLGILAGRAQAQDDPNVLPPEPGTESSTGIIFAPEEKMGVGDEYDIPSGTATCARTLNARVVAFDRVIFYNRLMAFLPPGMMYALERDVEPISGTQLSPGNVKLRDDKRPRPLVLRMNVGDCLKVQFTNYLARERVDGDQPATRSASMQIDGLSLGESMISSGSNVGDIDPADNGLAEPGESRTYLWYASKSGPFLFHSAGAMTGGEGDGGQAAYGLFGVVNVEPSGSLWYRSQVTAEELRFATRAIVNGLPVMNYGALYPAGHRFAGKPVLEILDGIEIFHGDLNAIITNIPLGTFPDVAAAAPDNGGPGGIVVERDRHDPFREFTIVYHDEEALIQAFPVLQNEFFAHSIRDNMAINYGTGGIGAEIISYGADEIVGANTHIPAGMAAKCNDCKYEEAFLSAWAVGDPAMVFEREDPTNPADPPATGRAIRALYPDDPSNVHHSYLNDHVKMRVVHGGVAEHHIHHLHAHQWLHQQNGDDSTYFDSQAIGPGSTFTLDITYNGSGNRNKTIGDSIFHCHFYPHFAQGMWELWRVHDVFEDGTRTLPDVELPGGSPIPALVPLPEMPMAPAPSATMPGFPFYIPGEPGHRPPHPPLDFYFDGTEFHDGGLPRHVVLGGKVLDGRRGPFDREMLKTDAMLLSEFGTVEEQQAMAFHAQRFHATQTPEGDTTDVYFTTNGRQPANGAPYADPCVDDNGNPVGLGPDGEPARQYAAAAIQIDAFFNKAAWHFDQWRMLSLWGDVEGLKNGRTPPEPFFIRANSGECIEYLHTNLIPNFYDIDDFQIFTPTDVIGQHIHLVKFDVTASDGAGNGWNYEDGTFAPEEVLERINAINAAGGLIIDDAGNREMLVAKEHPFFEHVPGVEALGAQTTVQRWWADPLLNMAGQDRTIRTVFTHDHFGPSTHQQAGLYAGLLVEKANSSWRDPESGVIFGDRFDGGPTSWRADILTDDPAESFREFALEHQDFHLAYEGLRPINPPGRIEVPIPHLVAPPPEPMPEAISADDVGMMSVNYRNEPLALRLGNPAFDPPVQSPFPAGDPAHAYRSNVVRKDARFNVQPNFYPPLTAGVLPGDPFTPLLRAYEGDRVHIRLLEGATEEGHNFGLHGLKWLHEPSDPKSGYRNNQMNGISEHFEMEVGLLPEVENVLDTGQFARGEFGRRFADYLYQPGASVDDQWGGNWGLIREYEGLRPDLLPLPSNPDGKLPEVNRSLFRNGKLTCPRAVPVRKFNVTAVRAADVLPNRALVYNQGHGLTDPTALMYVRTRDIQNTPFGPRLRPGTPLEPIVLRARAGECIRMTVNNGFLADPADVAGFNFWPMLIEQFNANQIRPSAAVGIHPQLVHHDIRNDTGFNIGLNPVNTVPRSGTARTYEWYAGKLETDGVTGVVTATPVEFGATNLIPADQLKHSNKGLVGALVIEPKNARWSFPQPGTRATADIEHTGGTYREFVMVFQDDVNILLNDGTPMPPPGGGTPEMPAVEDAEDSGNSAINYRAEPMWTRLGYRPGLDFAGVNDEIFTQALNENSTGPIETPIFKVAVGQPIRFRTLMPGGHPRNHIISIHGHMWRHEPNNPISEFIGSQAGHGPGGHWDMIPLHGAGGAFGVPGDYLYRTRQSISFDGGLWGVLRVSGP